MPLAGNNEEYICEMVVAYSSRRKGLRDWNSYGMCRDKRIWSFDPNSESENWKAREDGGRKAFEKLSPIYQITRYRIPKALGLKTDLLNKEHVINFPFLWLRVDGNYWQKQDLHFSPTPSYVRKGARGRVVSGDTMLNEWMNECKRGRPSRPLHRDLVVYCASPFSIVPSATQRFGWSAGFWT
jgi:hypothetical protein